MSPEEASKPQPYMTTDSQSPSGVYGFVMPLSTLYKWIPESILKEKNFPQILMKGSKTNFPTFQNKSCGHYLRVYRAFNAFYPQRQHFHSNSNFR